MAVQLSASDITEVSHGLTALAKTLKRAAQLGGALELETTKREQLKAQMTQLNEGLAGSGGYAIKDDELYAARVSVRLRYGALKRLLLAEKKKGVDPNADVETRVDLLEKLGKRCGIQLDLIETTEEDEEEGEDAE